ncbi:hypothetical protein, partial [Burkholderia gladioli]|uniref:hypothetical protein n=1 Tax=Burkholderia gladioli TaxID=28095 RepID=UPI0011B20C86
MAVARLARRGDGRGHSQVACTNFGVAGRATRGDRRRARARVGARRACRRRIAVAIALGFGSMALARLLTGFPHGTYFGV